MGKSRITRKSTSPNSSSRRPEFFAVFVDFGRAMSWTRGILEFVGGVGPERGFEVVKPFMVWGKVARLGPTCCLGRVTIGHPGIPVTPTATGASQRPVGRLPVAGARRANFCGAGQSNKQGPVPVPITNIAQDRHLFTEGFHAAMICALWRLVGDWKVKTHNISFQCQAMSMRAQVLTFVSRQADPSKLGRGACCWVLRPE